MLSLVELVYSAVSTIGGDKEFNLFWGDLVSYPGSTFSRLRVVFAAGSRMHLLLFNSLESGARDRGNTDSFYSFFSCYFLGIGLFMNSN